MANVQETHQAGSIGERIRRARKNAGLSQVDLARRIGVSQPAIATWESGVHDPRRVVLARLAEALSISLEWLAAGARSSAESDKQAAAAYLRRPVRHVPIISFESAAAFAENPTTDPHDVAEDYISITATASQLFGLFLNDPAVDLAFPAGSLVIIDYGDRSPGEGAFCLAAVDGSPVVRRLRSEPPRLESLSAGAGVSDVLVDERVSIIGCVRVSIRLH
jgi:transcriptional regulator with XRE-family HTH domain